MDLPGDDRAKAADYFCYAINNGPYRNIHFALDAIKQCPRVILTGNTSDVLKLINEYYASNL